jgi:amino acid transporter
MSTKTLGFIDLVALAVSMGLSIRWISSAAAAGPASLPGWALAIVVFSVPLLLATAELTARFPQEGGVYAWTGAVFGPFWGFLCGWLYWTCNLPFFSGLLYFMVNLLALALGDWGTPLTQQPWLFLAASLLLALGVGALHLRGLADGKWLSNLGAAANLWLFAVLIGAGTLVALKRGPATDFVHASYILPPNADSAILWSTMVFAVGGGEALAFLRNDVRGGMRTILAALAVLGIVQALAYALGTAGMLAILTPQEATRLSGLPDALIAGLTELGLGQLAPIVLMAAFFGILGAYSAWFGVAARLPFAAGVDAYLPKAFGYRDPKTGAPNAAIIVQTLIVIVILIISQAGDTLKGAYDFLVAMTVLSYTLPFLFLFAVFIAVQRQAIVVTERLIPGGANGARLVGWIGMAATLTAVICTMVPSPDADDQLAAALKLIFACGVLVGSGAIAYLIADRNRRRL